MVDQFHKHDEPVRIGFLAAANGIGAYPAFRYKGTDRITVNSAEEDDKAMQDGYHQFDYVAMDVSREVDLGYDLMRLNPMQLAIYCDEIGMKFNTNWSIADFVIEIQRFMLTKPQYSSRMCLIAQAIEFDYDGAQEEIRAAVKNAGGYLI